MYTRAKSLPNLYIRNIIPTDTSIPLRGYRALSGWGYAPYMGGWVADLDVRYVIGIELRHLEQFR
jgi:hypothetical protein